MPEITFTSNGHMALELWHLSLLLKGDAVKRRENLRKKITEAWPEIMEVGENEEAEKARILALGADRSFVITSKEQNAIAEPMLVFMKDKDVADSMKICCFKIAKLCRFPKWLDKQLDSEGKDFDGSDDAPIIEEEAPPAITEEKKEK